MNRSTPGLPVHHQLPEFTQTHVHYSRTIHNSQTREQPKGPATDEQIKTTWYVNTVEHYSVIKKNEILPFVATRMPLEVIVLSEVSQKEKNKYHMVSLMWILKYGTNESIYRTDWRQKEKRVAEDEMLRGIPDTMDMNLSKLWELVKDREAGCAAVRVVAKIRTRLSNWTATQRTDLWLPRETGGRGMDWECGVSRCKLFHLEWINSKGLLRRNYIQTPGISHNGKEYKERMYACV